MDKKLVMKIAKIAVPVASIAVTIATNFLSEKDLDDKIAKKLAESLKND